jgi:2,4-dienoyl-CoA reductase-like NADH-dependent reductase (Old Yellow Enzyme family)
MHLRRRIELYLRRTRISAAAFGRLAMNDPRFVQDLRNGREPREKTEKRVQLWLDTEEQQR